MTNSLTYLLVTRNKENTVDSCNATSQTNTYTLILYHIKASDSEDRKHKQIPRKRISKNVSLTRTDKCWRPMLQQSLQYKATEIH